MNDQTYGAATSSVDPTQLSTTLLSLARTVAGLLLSFGFFTADQDNSFLTHTSIIIQAIVIGAPLAYSMWHSSEALFGLFQKALVVIFKKKPVVVPVTLTPGAGQVGYAQSGTTQI